MNSGIYKIKNLINGKVYIGQSSRLNSRWGAHLCSLRANCHYNPHLQNSWNKYGEKAFSFSISFLCPEEELNFYEQLSIDSYPKDSLYNMGLVISQVGENNSFYGKTHKESSKEKMRKAKLGKKLKPQHKEKIRATLWGNTRCRGYKHSEETRRKKSETLKSVSREKNWCKPVIRTCLKTGKKTRYDSLATAAKSCSGQRSHIRAVCQGSRKSHKGFFWEFSVD